jgi:hypothetical protein
VWRKLARSFNLCSPDLRIFIDIHGTQFSTNTFARLQRLVLSFVHRFTAHMTYLFQVTESSWPTHCKHTSRENRPSSKHGYITQHNKSRDQEDARDLHICKDCLVLLYLTCAEMHEHLLCILHHTHKHYFGDCACRRVFDQ